MAGEHPRHHGKINRHHERHKQRRHPGNAADSADNNESYRGGYREAHSEACGWVVDAPRGQSREQSFGKLVGVYYAEGSEEAGYGEEACHPVAASAGRLLDDMHRAPLRLSGGIAAAVELREHAFVVFCRHPYQCADPHPENGTGASDDESYRHSGDVTHADRSGYYRHQSLK